MRQHSVRRRLAVLVALAVAGTGLSAVTAAPATAAPAPLTAPGDHGDDGEGGSKSLIDQLEAASKGYVEAKEALDESKKRQSRLILLIRQLDSQLGPRQQAIDEIVQETYRVGRLGPMKALLTAESTGSMLDRAETLESIAVKQDRALRDLKDARDKQQRAKLAVDAEIRDQQKQLTIMAKRKAQAENALKAAGQGQDAKGSGSGKSSTAASFNGGSGGCSTDPTGTGGCITSRMRHAYDQARNAGFTRYTKCYRSQSSGEHGKGRACDFSAHKGTFGGDATGADRTYGNNLANFFINNSGRLGVLYVIWYRRIWLPSSGWKSYSGAGGDPSSDHSNHVHLSVR